MSDDTQAVDAQGSAAEAAHSPNGNGDGRAVIAEVASGKGGRKVTRTPRIAASAEVPQEPLPDQMDETDLPYHSQVVQEFKDAQAAMQSWMKFCAMKYRLSQGARITDSGKIVRSDPAMMQQIPS